jgi:hypothetical protein
MCDVIVVAILCVNYLLIPLSGIGTIILGVLRENLWVVVAGVLQLCLPFVGWIWSIIWGVLIIKKAGWF